MGEGPIGIVAQGLVQVVADAVGLDVGLVVDIEPVAVAQRVPIGVIGIMGGPDRVEMVGLEGADVGLHGGLVHDVAGLRMVFVAVGALDEDGFPVDFDQAVFDADVPETDLEAGGLEDLAVGIEELDGDLVQGRRFGRPAVDAREALEPVDACGVTGVHAGRQVKGGQGAAFPRHGHAQVAVKAALAVVGDLRGQRQGAGEKVVLETGVGDHIGQVRLGPGVEPDLSLDARQPPEVLAFEEAAVAPAVDLEGEGVGALPHRVGDVEFGGQLGPLTVADALAIDPQEEGRLDRAEVQQDALALPWGRKLEVSAVAAHRVPAVGDVGRVRGLLPVEWVGMVGVNRRAVSVQLPVGRHRDVVPPAHVVLGRLEAHGTFPG